MLPVRVTLNVVYAMLVDGLDKEQRDELDAEVYGWAELNERGNRALRGPDVDDTVGG